MTCLTPPGRGAIATLAVRGPLAWPVTRELFRGIAKDAAANPASTALPEIATPGRFWLGWLGETQRGGADEMVLLVRQIDPVVWLELHCHGGPEVVRLLEEQYQARGISFVPWPEFERQHMPAWQAEAQLVLAHASTVRTASIALDQWHGAFQQTVEECCRRWGCGERETASRTLLRLHELAGVGRHLVQPWRVVLAGAPNVGKSSLANALAGHARSIVAPTPGTTRDVVTTTIALDGWPIELADTAGLRASAERLEQAGMTRAQKALDAADLCLWLVDGAAAPVLPPDTGDRMVVVINKIDLPEGWDWASQAGALRVSAMTAAGLPELVQRIADRLVPSPPLPGEAVPYLEAQCETLTRIATALREGREDDVTALLPTLL